MITLLLALSSPASAAPVCTAGRDALVQMAATFPIPDWSSTDGDGRTGVHVYPCQLDIWLPGEDGLTARDQLWDEWTGWLVSAGFTPASRDQHMPWNQVRWQAFQRGDLRVELQVRRPWGDSGDWEVLLTP